MGVTKCILRHFKWLWFTLNTQEILVYCMPCKILSLWHNWCLIACYVVSTLLMFACVYLFIILWILSCIVMLNIRLDFNPEALPLVIQCFESLWRVINEILPTMILLVFLETLILFFLLTFAKVLSCSLLYDSVIDFI